MARIVVTRPADADLGLVLPYLVIHAHAERTDTVAILRAPHGNRQINRGILRGPPRRQGAS